MSNLINQIERILMAAARQEENAGAISFRQHSEWCIIWTALIARSTRSKTGRFNAIQSATKEENGEEEAPACCKTH